MFESNFWAFFRLVVSLPIVLVLAYFGTKFVLNRKFFQVGYKTRAIKVIDRVQLGPKSFLTIVEIDDQYHLIGSTENSISLLKELENFTAPESLDGFSYSGLNNFKFEEMLEKQLSKIKGKLRKGERQK